MVRFKNLLPLMNMAEKIVVTDDFGLEIHHGTVRDASLKKFDDLYVVKIATGLISGMEIKVKHADSGTGRIKAGAGRTCRGKPCRKQEGGGMDESVTVNGETGRRDYGN